MERIKLKTMEIKRKPSNTQSENQQHNQHSHQLLRQNPFIIKQRLKLKTMEIKRKASPSQSINEQVSQDSPFVDDFISKPNLSGISQTSSSKIESTRQNMPVFLFLMITVLFLLFAYLGIIIFFTALSDEKTYFIIFAMITSSLVMVMTGRHLVSFIQMLKMYFLIDTLALSFSVAVIAFIGAAKSSQSSSAFFANTLYMIMPPTQFILTGTYRIIIKHANLKRWQNIIFKCVILLDGLCSFVLGFYIMYSGYKPTKGILASVDNQFKDFSILYVFGNLAFYKQLCCLHNNFDRTNKLKYSYKLIGQIEEDFEQNQ